ncbi:MAG: CehA/McbA family metallohydrolase, partial [Planctomycetes bacterium]|nr:CehA/McbA family metallohydrolase [Planctomycetota bacterium]
PYFFPDTGEQGVHNVYYSHNGRFRQPLEPGRYETIISYGPEYDAVFKQILVERGVETSLNARLIRSVDTTGWISSDFHSHSSPSGDNSASQLGRVLNLLCEHIEFAPCTEHNRLDTYVPHLRALGAEHLMATAVGIELTGSPGPLNHQNAFPLIRKAHTQDNGGPVTDKDPFVQIERLALWDNKSEKLVQENHPNIVQLLFDKNLDGKADAAHHKMLTYMNVIEVHPPGKILQGPSVNQEGINDGKNRMHAWLQMLNQGHRVWGVVNTDAHYNFHGSGWLRNYIKSPTDDPAAIKTLDIVRESKRGHIIMTNGPFLEVILEPANSDEYMPSFPGDQANISGGSVRLKIRVQCPNWFDIDRVQVLLNGQAEANLNITRKNSPGKFSDTVIKFDQTLLLELKRDTHVIVVAIGEQSSLGPVMGPGRQESNPIAVSNPIYVDADGNGFQPNGDTLGAPLPILSISR